MFLLFGMVMVTIIVWAIGDDELSLIQEHMPHYDQNVLSFALYQMFTLIPFLISLAFQVLNFWLITLDTNEEIKWYMSKQKRGMKIINGCLLFSLFALFVITVLYSLQGNNYEYYFGKASDGIPQVGMKQVFTKFAGFCQCLMIRLLANSKVEDVMRAYNEERSYKLE